MQDKPSFEQKYVVVDVNSTYNSGVDVTSSNNVSRKIITSAQEQGAVVILSYYKQNQDSNLAPHAEAFAKRLQKETGAKYAFARPGVAFDYNDALVIQTKLGAMPENTLCLTSNSQAVANLRDEGYNVCDKPLRHPQALIRTKQQDYDGRNAVKETRENFPIILQNVRQFTSYRAV